MTGIIRHIVTIHIHKLILILHVPICFQKTTKSTKATFIFKSLKGSYLQKPLWFTSTISGGQSNSSHFYLIKKFTFLPSSHKVGSNAGCICKLIRLCCIPTVCCFTSTYSLQMGKGKGESGMDEIA